MQRYLVKLRSPLNAIAQSTITPQEDMNIKEARAKACLDKVFSYSEGVMSRRDWLDLQKRKSCRIEQVNKRNSAAEEKERKILEKMFFDIPINMGNSNNPDTKKYLERKAKLDQGFFEATYRIYTSNRTFLEITKTEYDYFLGIKQ